MSAGYEEGFGIEPDLQVSGGGKIKVFDQTKPDVIFLIAKVLFVFGRTMPRLMYGICVLHHWLKGRYVLSLTILGRTFAINKA